METPPDPSDQIEDLLTCGFCRETVKEPRTLGCFHSYCTKCLARYVEIQRKEAQDQGKTKRLFNCPQCRTQFELKEGESVDHVPRNDFINNTLDLMPFIQQQHKVHCESCEGQVSVTCRCADCERYLCKDCLKAHNNWPDLKSHVVLTLEELAKPENHSKAKRKLRCGKDGHRNKQLEFYCSTCHEQACVNCVLLDHPKPDHNYEAIDIVVGKRKEELRTTSAILQKISDQGQNALQKIEQCTQNLQVSAKKAKEVILQQEKEILEEFTEKLKQGTEALLGQVDKKHNKVNESLVKQRDEIKFYVKKVNGSLVFAKNIIEKGSNEEILSLQEDISVNAGNIKKQCPKSMQPVDLGYFEYERKKTSKDIVDNLDLGGLGRISTVDPVVQSLLERSTILDGNTKHEKQLVEWVDYMTFAWKLCYRASVHGWEGWDFHRKCDDVGPTVTLVKCGTHMFGGYTERSWNSGFYSEYKRSNKSFLFSLRNKDNLKPFKCPIYDHQNDKAIFCSPLRGATFGAGWDMVISSDANTNQYSYTDPGNTYRPPRGYEPGTPQTKALLAGSYKFTPTEIEVFCR